MIVRLLRHSEWRVRYAAVCLLRNLSFSMKNDANRVRIPLLVYFLPLFHLFHAKRDSFAIKLSTSLTPFQSLIMQNESVTFFPRSVWI